MNLPGTARFRAGPVRSSPRRPVCPTLGGEERRAAHPDSPLRQRMDLRVTEVALPLIVLQQTDSVWATGLVAGSWGIALLTSPWWAARLRHRLTSGPALAAVLVVQALGYATVAVAATLDNLTIVHLFLGGLIVAAATSVAGPATRALLADLGDRIGPGVAVRALAWQDLAHRI